MTGTQIGTEADTVRQGQHTACRRHPPVPDNHGAVMQGCLGEEDIPQQLLGYPGIQLGAGFEIFLQPLLPGKDNQCAHLFPAHDVTGHDGLHNHGFHLLNRLGIAEKGTQPHISQMIQHPPQLRLEQHHKGQQSHRQELAQDEVDGVKLRHIRQPGDDDNGHSHLGNPGRAGGLEQGKQFIDDQRHQCNVQKVGPLHDRQLRHQIVNGFHVCNSLFYVNFSAERTPLSYTYLLSSLL